MEPQYCMKHMLTKTSGLHCSSLCLLPANKAASSNVKTFGKTIGGCATSFSSCSSFSCSCEAFSHQASHPPWALPELWQRRGQGKAWRSSSKNGVEPLAFEAFPPQQLVHQHVHRTDLEASHLPSSFAMPHRHQPPSPPCRSPADWTAGSSHPPGCKTRKVAALPPAAPHTSSS